MANRRPSKYGKGFYSNYSVGGRPLAKPYRKKGRHPKLWSSGHKKRGYVASNPIGGIIVALFMLGVVLGMLCYFMPFMVAVVAFPIIIGLGDWLLKKVWDLPKGRWSPPASTGWLVLTCLEMIVSFFMGILVTIGEIKASALIISVVIYVLLSVLVLNGRHKKLLRKREIEQDDLKDIEASNCVDKYDNISAVDGMDGHEFEYFCAELLKCNGFSEVRVTKGSGDQGVDIIADKRGLKYAIQCKNYAAPLGNKPVQEVATGKIFYDCNVAIVLTNSTFTAGAISLADATGVLLWDRTVLVRLMEQTPLVGAYVNDRLVGTYRNAAMRDSADEKCFNATVANKNHSANHSEEFDVQSAKQCVDIDDITIEIDLASMARFGIIVENFGIDMDKDYNADQIELLFDVCCKRGRKIPCDIDIVCNLYAGQRKILTEKMLIDKDVFRGRDSLSVLFDKRNVCKTATRIELFCIEFGI